jgi:hypothetical protein
MAWVASSRAARSAIAPKTPRAMPIGFSDRSALAATGAVACTAAIALGGIRRAISNSTCATSLLPWSVWIEKTSAPAKSRPERATTSSVRAGVKMMKLGTRSISSSMISELSEAKPTSFAVKAIAGRTADVPKPGDSCCCCE